MRELDGKPCSICDRTGADYLMCMEDGCPDGREMKFYRDLANPVGKQLEPGTLTRAGNPRTAPYGKVPEEKGAFDKVFAKAEAAYLRKLRRRKFWQVVGWVFFSTLGGMIGSTIVHLFVAA